MRSTSSAAGAAILFILILIIGMLFSSGEIIRAQVAATATPRRVALPSATPFPTGGSSPTPTQTPTEEAAEVTGILLQALETAGDVNVRIEGDIEGDLVGSIRFGDTYTVTGRNFRWYRIAFPSSPTGQAFVFEDLVEIVAGNVADIPNLTVIDNPSPAGAASEDLDTPSVIASQTPDARQIAPPSGEGVTIPQDGGAEAVLEGVLPTFTYPPLLASPNATQLQTDTDVNNAAVSVNEQNGIAPIVPILVLGALGAIGIILSSLRR